MPSKTGKIIPHGVSLEKHENDIVVIFTEMGLDVELIPRSKVDGVKTPDAIIAGEKWEFKSPRGKSKWLLENTLHRASHQSCNVVIDLRHTRIPEKKCIQKLKQEFTLRKKVKRLKIITKSQKIIDLKR